VSRDTTEDYYCTGKYRRKSLGLKPEPSCSGNAEIEIDNRERKGMVKKSERVRERKIVGKKEKERIMEIDR